MRLDTRLLEQSKMVFIVNVVTDAWVILVWQTPIVDQELLEAKLARRKTQQGLDHVDSLAELALEAILLVVADYEQLIVANVRRAKLCISLDCLLNCFKSCLIVMVIVLSRINRSRDHVYDRVVSLVTELNVCPSGLIQYFLPLLVAHVADGVH